MTHTSPIERTGPTGLTPRQLMTLRLMAEGHTDDAIATRLGLSGRTVRRVATELMATLGVRSRFAAGVYAVRRGWLPADDGYDEETPWPPSGPGRAGHGVETTPRGQEARRGGGRRCPISTAGSAVGSGTATGSRAAGS